MCIQKAKEMLKSKCEGECLKSEFKVIDSDSFWLISELKPIKRKIQIEE